MVDKILELEETIESLIEAFEEETKLAVTEVVVARTEDDGLVSTPKVKIQFVAPYRTEY